MGVYRVRLALQQALSNVRHHKHGKCVDYLALEMCPETGTKKRAWNTLSKQKYVISGWIYLPVF